MVQVNGKLRSRIYVPFGTSEGGAGSAARWPTKRSQPFLAGKQVVKMITVPDKLVNVVVR